jgi:hypothetical protein
MILNSLKKRIQACVAITLFSAGILIHVQPSEARRRAGFRGTCEALKEVSGQKFLTALIPRNEKTNSGINVPKLWFAIPFDYTPDVSAKITVRDRNGKFIAESTNIVLPKRASIISLELPNPLQKDVPYHWFFAIKCGSSSPDSILEVDGWTRWLEVDADVTKELKNATSLEKKVRIYLRAGYWSDALTLIAENQDKDPQAKALWEKLLKGDRELEDLTTTPIQL